MATPTIPMPRVQPDRTPSLPAYACTDSTNLQHYPYMSEQSILPATTEEPMAIPRGFPPTYTCLPIHSEQILSSTPSVTRVGSDENTQQHTSTLPIPREDYSAIDYAVSPPLDENRSMFVRRFERCATLMVDSPRLERSELESIGCGYGWGAPIQGNVVLEGSMATAWGGVVEVEVKLEGSICLGFANGETRTYPILNDARTLYGAASRNSSRLDLGATRTRGSSTSSIKSPPACDDVLPPILPFSIPCPSTHRLSPTYLDYVPSREEPALSDEHSSNTSEDDPTPSGRASLTSSSNTSRSIDTSSRYEGDLPPTLNLALASDTCNIQHVNVQYAFVLTIWMRNWLSGYGMQLFGRELPGARYKKEFRVPLVYRPRSRLRAELPRGLSGKMQWREVTWTTTFPIGGGETEPLIDESCVIKLTLPGPFVYSPLNPIPWRLRVEPANSISSGALRQSLATENLEVSLLRTFVVRPPLYTGGSASLRYCGIHTLTLGRSVLTAEPCSPDRSLEGMGSPMQLSGKIVWCEEDQTRVCASYAGFDGDILSAQVCHSLPK
ncbi:hypothetical protein BDV98DRAFT_577489 [Pterulicium gracile]|uniref:Uncharacterized protein n=1 Tax=Pterulicium gracile TaxID=1884261 RepID=A0A5C3Q0F5_9AGAR|nr:hypothetical protein BDV98DRAFT_577489 [Pterula gracilis]